MAKLTSKQANELSGHFLGLAQAIGNFRYNNWDALSAKENKVLGNFQWSILNYGEDILALSTNLVLDEVETSLTQIENITTDIKSTIETISDIPKGINVAAAIVTLGAAIISTNQQAIVDSIKGIADAWNT